MRMSGPKIAIDALKLLADKDEGSQEVNEAAAEDDDEMVDTTGRARA